MHRLGRSNWWYPRWLDRVTPRVSVEPPEDHVIEPRVPEPAGR
jgi:RND superfamily putative drug exporter